MGEINRMLQPKVIETKQELLAALHTGKLAVSKYNLLNDREKMFVELVAFGDYTGEQAVRIIDPKTKVPQVLANQLMSNKDVAETLEELSISRDKKFMAEISTARDMALNKLKYIMTTTKDDSLAASCAKVILDKAAETVKQMDKKEDPVGQVRFAIQVENNYNMPPDPALKGEPVIITLDEQQEAKLRKKGDNEPMFNNKLPVNPDTGLPYTISYEGVNAYDDNGGKE